MSQEGYKEIPVKEESFTRLRQRKAKLEASTKEKWTWDRFLLEATRQYKNLPR